MHGRMHVVVRVLADYLSDRHVGSGLISYYRYGHTGKILNYKRAVEGAASWRPLREGFADVRLEMGVSWGDIIYLQL